jgi:RluA family pseudouridine synthase
MPLPPILHEDDTLIAFDKPSEAPGPSGLLAAARARHGAGLAPVHRLDPEASGVLLCAKTKAALDFLSGQFQAKTAGQVYLALAVVGAAGAAEARVASGGLRPEFSVELALGEDRERPGRMRVLAGRAGRASATDFRILEPFGRFAWIECRPRTARTHQIRVHLAAAGAPVLQDGLYGDPEAQLLLSGLKRRYKGRESERPLVRRLALHSSEVTVLHPSTRAPLAIRSPLPADLEVALKYLRKFAARA